MKKVIIVAVLLAAIIGTTNVSAAVAGIDISGLSNEELVELREEIDQKLFDNGETDTINEGVYVVGKDIKAGTYELSSKAIESIDWTFVYVYNSKEDCDKGHKSARESYIVGNRDSNETELDEYHSVSVTLEESNVISIEENTCLIKPYEASWQVK